MISSFVYTVDNPEVSSAVEALAMELRVPPHPSARDLMCAVASLVTERLGVPVPTPASPTVLAPAAPGSAPGAGAATSTSASAPGSGSGTTVAKPAGPPAVADRLPIELLDSGLDTKGSFSCTTITNTGHPTPQNLFVHSVLLTSLQEVNWLRHYS